MADPPDQPKPLSPHHITIISGGQTGVDRTALEVALKLNLPCGGWCPRGRLAEDGVIDEKYPLRETPSDQYPQRTEYNVRDADATLIIAVEPLTGGTLLTQHLARQKDKPCLLIAPGQPDAAAIIFTWLVKHKVRTLNVAGPRQSTNTDFEKQTADLLEEVFLRVSNLEM